MISHKLLYLVKDQSFGPRPPLMLGIGVEVHKDWVGFHDTNRGHQFYGKLVMETGDGFVWHRIEDTLEGGYRDSGLIEFRVLSLGEYNKKIRPRLAGPIPEFHSDEELHEFYWRNFGRRGYHY